MNRTMRSLKKLFQNVQFLGRNGGPSKIRIFESHEVLWINRCEPNYIQYSLKKYLNKYFLGNRLKCVACRIVVHEACAATLNEKFTCRPSFCESVRKYREFTSVPHHWVQRKQLKVGTSASGIPGPSYTFHCRKYGPVLKRTYYRNDPRDQLFRNQNKYFALRT